MKIAHVAYFPPAVKASHFGIGHAVHYLSEELVRLGHDVTVFVSWSPGIKKFKEHSYKIKTLWPVVKFGHIFFAPTLWFGLRKFDIVNVHYPFWGALEIVGLYKFLHKDRMKFVISYDADILPKGFDKKILRWQYKNILPRVVSMVDKIIVSSADYLITSDAFGQFYAGSPRFGVASSPRFGVASSPRLRLVEASKTRLFAEVPFGAADQFFPEPKDKRLMARYGLKDEDVVLMFIGILDRTRSYKGLNYLLKAMEYLDANVKLIIGGNGEMREFYQTKAIESGLGKRMIFTGYIKEDEMRQHYNLCDIFILPSINRGEACSAVALEAMACAKPLIMTNLKGVRSIIDPGVNGMLVEPKNSRDIVDKVKFLLQRPQLMVAMGQNGADRVNWQYRWPSSAKKMEEIYKKLATKKQGVQESNPR
ncbi:glycosyltransferase family 4 protein [Candidatus Falkowbacteria bacterium]|nr:glycosyltransferase family 4 protein [Candidatus Falkowbacteria bacterium]